MFNINRLFHPRSTTARNEEGTPGRTGTRPQGARAPESPGVPEGSQTPLPARRGGARSDETSTPRRSGLGSLLRSPLRSATASTSRQPGTVAQEIDAWLARNAPLALRVSSGINLHNGREDTRRAVLQDAAQAIRDAATSGATTLEWHSGFPATTLPEAIGRMQSLQHLSLRHTGLTSLPDSLGQLIRLQHLDLAANHQLTRLPASLTSLPALQTLMVHMTPLGEVPADIGNMQSLRRLELGGGRYEHLPASLTNLVQLRRLDLASASNVRELPADIGRMQGLRFLGVKWHAKLERLPASLTQLHGLRELDLSRNRSLQALPEDLGRLGQLTSLSLRECSALQSLPDSVADLRHLRLLDLIGTGLTSLPGFLAELPAECEIRVPDHLQLQLDWIRNPQSTWPGEQLQSPSPSGSGARPRRGQPEPSWDRGPEFTRVLEGIDSELGQRFKGWMTGLQQNAFMFRQQPPTAADMRLLDQVVAEAISSPGFRSNFSQFLFAHTPKSVNMDGITQVASVPEPIKGDVRTAYAQMLEYKLMRTQDAEQATTMLLEAIRNPDLRMSSAELLSSRNPLTGHSQMWPPLLAYVSKHDEIGAAAQDAAVTWAMAHHEEAQEGGIQDVEAKTESDNAQSIANGQIKLRAEELVRAWGFGGR